jgi:hypothetical protein
MERKKLLRYSSCFYGPDVPELEEVTRVVLAELFAGMARAIMEEKDFQFHKVKHISLVLETDLWDHKLVMILDRDDEEERESEA